MIFKPNLTTRLLLAAADTWELSGESVVCDIGCGSGYIIGELFKSCSEKAVAGVGLDISVDAINLARRTYSDSRLRFEVADIQSAAPVPAANFYICDVAGIAEDVAAVSGWYEGVDCATGESGMRLIEIALKKMSRAATPRRASLIMPIISLSDVKLHMDLLTEYCTDIELGQSKYWPVPESLQQLVNHSPDVFLRRFELENKFGVWCAYSRHVSCKFKGG